jgi:hypothetical protein
MKEMTRCFEEKGFLKKVSRETGKTGKLTEKMDKT